MAACLQMNTMVSVGTVLCWTQENVFFSHFATLNLNTKGLPCIAHLILGLLKNKLNVAYTIFIYLNDCK